jgi:hypothetical protein
MHTTRRPDVIARVRRASRAPLPESERRQLDLLVAGLGPIAAARSLGVKVGTLHSARTGADVNPSTRATMQASGWLLPSEGTSNEQCAAL